MSKNFIARRFLLLIMVFGLPWSSGAQNPPGDFQSFAGQKFILHGYGRRGDVKVKLSDVEKSRSGCDVPVEILKVLFSGDALRFDLHELGELSGGRFVSSCPRGVASNTTGSLTISGVSPTDPVAAIGSVLNSLLMTPDTYLSSRGMNWKLLPAPDGEPVIPPGQDVTIPVLLIQIIPNYSEAARLAKQTGDVRFSAVIGADGRLHSPQILSQPGPELGEMALRTLPLWRFQPAQQGGKPVAFKITASIRFDLR